MDIQEKTIMMISVEDGFCDTTIVKALAFLLKIDKISINYAN